MVGPQPGMRRAAVPPLAHEAQATGAPLADLRPLLLGYGQSLHEIDAQPHLFEGVVGGQQHPLQTSCTWITLKPVRLGQADEVRERLADAGIGADDIVAAIRAARRRRP